MTLLPTTLSAIQRAGQAVYEAHAALNQATDAHAARVGEALAANAFAQENDALFSNWKTVARLAQEFDQVEAQLRALYATASALNRDSAITVAAVAQLPAPQAAAKPAAKRAIKQVTKQAIKKAAKAAAKPATEAAAQPAAEPAMQGTRVAAPSGADSGLKGNNAKVMAYLEAVLNKDSFTLLPQARIADAAGIPKGSINLSMRQLQALKLVEEGAVKKTYKLL